MTRKLIKPNLSEIKKISKKDTRKKPPPPYKTHAENYYYIKQMNNRTPMIIELVTGEVFKGKIDWYDEKCIKVKRDDNKNYMVFKHTIKYIYKDPEFITEADEEKEEDQRAED